MALKHKYNAKKTQVDSIKFDSKKEGDRADFSDTDLSYADSEDIDLRNAVMINANFI